MNWFLFILAIFATYRLAELIAIDTIFEPFRQSIGKRVTQGSHNAAWYAAELVNCPYCLGIWFAFIFAIFIAQHSLGSLIITWLAIAGAQAFLESLAGRAE